ncbi:FAD/NAD(P)-binding protein, partial [Streptomyces hygroscopicus]|uniref:FAD/NAD(P)-binding protein n=1 Tax=Streptomyces hygroscopicus TaxID=1912 RepID=UPI0036AB68F5
MNDSAVPAQAPDRRPVDAVVVGAGPRGVSVLERLVARAVPGDRPLRAVLVDPYPPGAGRVWRRDQPPQLLMNTMVADNTVFPDGSVRLDAPVDTGPTFSEWLRAIAGKGHPDSTAAEFAARAHDRDYAPRRVYGAYLSDALERIRAAAGDRIRIAVRTAAVVRVTPLAAPGDAFAAPGDVSAAPGDVSAAPGDAFAAPAGYQVVLDDGERLAARAVVLATGHLDAPAAPPGREPLHLPGGHPTDYALDTIAPGARGLQPGGGGTGVDGLARHTPGRGGRFGG